LQFNANSAIEKSTQKTTAESKEIIVEKEDSTPEKLESGEKGSRKRKYGRKRGKP